MLILFFRCGDFSTAVSIVSALVSPADADPTFPFHPSPQMIPSYYISHCVVSTLIGATRKHRILSIPTSQFLSEYTSLQVFQRDSMSNTRINETEADALKVTTQNKILF
jgi:hypothetical protein